MAPIERRTFSLRERGTVSRRRSRYQGGGGVEQLLGGGEPVGGDTANGLRRVAPGVHRLYLAVLGRALADLSDPLPNVRQQARDWWESNDEALPFSFINTCSVLQLDAVALRRAERCRSQQLLRSLLQEP